jgi:tetratricopeptide (TPR) repeat protein
MLDILANFDWKRPIYFTGGANADEEYIWLKDYMQLDGMSYKLVPIKTPTKIYNEKGELVREVSLFDMGRIDPEKMYANIKKLDWKNINSGKIYIDEQTRRNAISLRNNLMRLSDVFLKQKDTAMAKEVLDLSLYKMPIEDFGHYSISLEYPEMYYKIGDKESARKTAQTLITIFQQKLKHYSTHKNLDLVFDNIDTHLYMYRNILKQIEEFDGDQEYMERLQNEFIENVQLFSSLLPDEDPADLENIKD